MGGVKGRREGPCPVLSGAAPRMRSSRVAAVVFSADLTGCACLGVDCSTNHLMPINIKNRSRDTV